MCINLHSQCFFFYKLLLQNFSSLHWFSYTPYMSFRHQPVANQICHSFVHGLVNDSTKRTRETAKTERQTGDKSRAKRSIYEVETAPPVWTFTLINNWQSTEQKPWGWRWMWSQLCVEASTIQDAGTAGFALPSLSRFESVARLFARANV